MASAAALGACASGGRQPAATTNGNVISTSEIARSSATNALELIQRLRPQFLSTRGAVHGNPTTAGNRLERVDLVVYLNESRLGGSDQLRDIPTAEIREIRYFSAADATTKWGTGHTAGAIQVLSR